MKKLWILLLLTFAGWQAMAQQEKLSPELLWKFGRVSGESVSPDGTTILYGVTYYNLAENKGNRDLYIFRGSSNTGKNKGRLNVGGTATQITNTPFSEGQAVWRPDGQKIGFLSPESGSMQLWEMNADGSERVQVTDVEGGISNFAYAPDMKHISFTQSVKLDKTVNEIYPDLPKADARIIDDLMYRHWDSWDDFSYSHLFVMDYSAGKVSGSPKDLMPGERFDTPLNPFGGEEQIAWTNDGASIAYTCKKSNGKAYAASTNSDIYLHNLATGKTENLTTFNPGYDVAPLFSPDGKSMAWLSMARDGYESDKNRIMVMDLATRKTTDLSQNFDDSADHLAWAKDSKKIYFVAGVRATYQVHSVDLATQSVAQLSNGKHNFNSVHVYGDKLMGNLVSMSMPAELYAINPEQRTIEALTTVNKPLLDVIQMGEVQERTVKTSDGKEMLVWVILPPDFDPNKKYPTLLYCQGGPQSAVSQFFSYRWNFQLMAAYGYVVVAPNRRGLPSFGTEWNEQISGDWGGQAIRDYLSAIDDVAKEPWADETRMGAVGASYGGYSVYFLAGNHQKRFKSFVSHCGLYNLESWYGSTEELFFANYDIKGPYWQAPQPVSYEKYSPHKFAKNWDTPILVIHGEQDFRVPVTQGMEAFQLAQLKGIPSRFLYYPGEGHWVLGPQNGILWHRVYFDWLAKTLN